MGRLLPIRYASRCRYCDTVIRADSTDELREEKRDHREDCDGSRFASNSVNQGADGGP